MASGYPAFRDSYILQQNNNVVGKTDPNSVDTADVGNIGIEFANGLTDFIAAINAFVFYTGTSDPLNTLGVEGDIYVQTNGGSTLVVWRKDPTSWAVQTTIPLGISYQDGIIVGLRTQLINTTNVQVSAGNWAISNTIYSKSITTVLTFGAAEVGSDRIDLIYANTSGNILLLAGAPSATPVKPTLPANSIEVDSIYVPASGTGFPYLFSSGIANGATPPENYPTSDLVDDGSGTFYLPSYTPRAGMYPMVAIVNFTSTYGTKYYNVQYDPDGNTLTGLISPDPSYTLGDPFPSGTITIKSI